MVINVFAFLKKYSDQIFKLVLNQIAMTFFGLIVSLATSENDTLFLLSSIFAILLYLFLEGSVLFELGEKDNIRVEAGHIAPMPLKGLWIALAANGVNLLLGILSEVGYLISAGGEFPHWAAQMREVCNIIARFIQSMYAGLIYTYAPHNPIALVLIVLPSLGICALAYFCGAKGFYLSKLLGIRKKKENK